MFLLKKLTEVRNSAKWLSMAFNILGPNGRPPLTLHHACAHVSSVVALWGEVII